jgi:predicted double-glycine peptidase
MLKIHPLKQPSIIISRRRETLCGPTCVRMVLAYYGVKKTEKELIQSVNYDPRLLDKKGASSLAQAAKKLGFHASVKDNSTLKDVRDHVLKRKVPVIVNWFSETEGHYSVVVHIDEKSIVLADPEIAGLRRMSLQEFEAVWFDFSPHDLRTPKALVVKRMIVIER